MNADNPFSQLDAQNPVSSFAQMTTEEHIEFREYLDMQRARLDERDGITVRWHIRVWQRLFGS